MFHSLSFRLVVIVFGIMLLANFITGVGYLYISLHAEAMPVPLVRFMGSPLQTLLMSLIIGTLLSAAFSKVLLGPLNQLIDATRKVADGDFSVRVTSTSSDDELDRLVGSFNDMTKELGSNELFKKDFINSFSHEFKTPIVSIRGFARQLERDDITDDERREYAGIIARESERLANMASNILLLTRLENQQFMPDVTEFRLDEQLRRAILLLEKQWSDKDIDLDLELPDTRVRANEEMLSHVWINIIGNAVKFTPAGGRIAVSCGRERDHIRVTVSDSGIGMDAETLGRIFDKFYQGDVSGSSEPSHSGDGNGLGLPLAKRIVELTGGRISVKSKVSEGSEFIVTLPVT